MKTNRFLLAAGIALAMAFTFSCSGGGGDDGGGGNNGNGGGGGGGGYTGSYGSVKDAAGKSYKTVKIGTQTWMAENLNYDPGTGKSACYDNQASNCATYGRLYDWETAMEVCPSGWHLPSDAEWTVLTDYVGDNAGTKLKATSGWDDYNTYLNGMTSGNGTNSYGFSALPGGYTYYSSSSYFYSTSVGNYGYWWSATEDNSNSGGPYFRNMRNTDSDVGRGSHFGFNIYSVRCVQD